MKFFLFCLVVQTKKRLPFFVSESPGLVLEPMIICLHVFCSLLELDVNMTTNVFPFTRIVWNNVWW